MTLRRTLLAGALTILVLAAGLAHAGSTPPPIKHPDYVGSYLGGQGSKVLLRVDGEGGKRRVVFQERNSVIECEGEGPRRQTLRPLRARFTRGDKFFGQSLYQDGGGFELYQVRGELLSRGVVAGEAMRVVNSFGGETGDCFTQGPWRAKRVR